MLEENAVEAYERILDDSPATRMTLKRSVGASFCRQAGRQLGHCFVGRVPLQAKQRLERTGATLPHGSSLKPAGGILSIYLS